MDAMKRSVESRLRGGIQCLKHLLINGNIRVRITTIFKLSEKLLKRDNPKNKLSSKRAHWTKLSNSSFITARSSRNSCITAKIAMLKIKQSWEIVTLPLCSNHVTTRGTPCWVSLLAPGSPQLETLFLRVSCSQPSMWHLDDQEIRLSDPQRILKKKARNWLK